MEVYQIFSAKTVRVSLVTKFDERLFLAEPLVLIRTLLYDLFTFISEVAVIKAGRVLFYPIPIGTAVEAYPDFLVTP